MTLEQYNRLKKKQAEMDKQKQGAGALNSAVDTAASSIPVIGQWYGLAKTGEGIGKSFIKKDEYGNAKGKTGKVLDSEFTPLHEQTINDITNKDWKGLALNTLLGGQYHTGAALFGKKSKGQQANVDLYNLSKQATQNTAPQARIADPNGMQTPTGGVGLNQMPQNRNSGIGLNGANNYSLNMKMNPATGSYEYPNTASQRGYGGYDSNGGYSSGYGGTGSFGGYGGYVQAGVGLGQAIAGYVGLQKNNIPDDLALTPEMQSALTRADQMSRAGYTPQEVANFMQQFQQVNNQRYRLGVTRAGGNLSNAVTASQTYGNLGALNQFAAGDAAQHRSNIRYADSLANRTQDIANMNNQRHWGLWNQKEQAYGQLMQQGLNNTIQGAGNIDFSGNRSKTPVDNYAGVSDVGMNNQSVLDRIPSGYNGKYNLRKKYSLSESRYNDNTDGTPYLTPNPYAPYAY